MLKVGPLSPPFFGISFVLLKLGGGGERLKGLKGHQIEKEKKSRPPTSTTFLWGLGKREGMAFFSWGRE